MARKLENIKVFACSLTEKIYAGHFAKGQDFNVDRVEVTDQVLTAVMTYMGRDETSRDIKCAAGTLKWIPNKDAQIRELECELFKGEK